MGLEDSPREGTGAIFSLKWQLLRAAQDTRTFVVSSKTTGTFQFQELSLRTQAVPGVLFFCWVAFLPKGWGEACPGVARANPFSIPLGRDSASPTRHLDSLSPSYSASGSASALWLVPQMLQMKWWGGCLFEGAAEWGWNSAWNPGVRKVRGLWGHSCCSSQSFCRPFLQAAQVSALSSPVLKDRTHREVC